MNCKYKTAAVLDNLFSLFVVFPLCVLHWRGTWDLQAVYFFPSNLCLSIWFSFFLGSVTCVVLLMLEPLVFKRFLIVDKISCADKNDALGDFGGITMGSNNTKLTTITNGTVSQNKPIRSELNSFVPTFGSKVHHHHHPVIIQCDSTNSNIIEPLCDNQLIEVTKKSAANNCVNINLLYWGTEDGGFNERFFGPSFSFWIYNMLYMYITGWCILFYWRGVWDLLDYYLTWHYLNSIIIAAVTYSIMIVSKTTRSTVGSPFYLTLDSDPAIFMEDVYTNMKSDRHTRRILTVLFHQFVTGTSCICVWRGLWNCVDTFFLPGNQLISDIASCLLGYILCGLLMLVQLPLSKISSKIEQHTVGLKMIYENIVMLCTLSAFMLMWRGMWDLCVTFIIPDPLVGGWVCHWLGTIGMIFTQTLNTVGDNGVDFDGQYSDGEGIYPVSYFTYLFKAKLKDEILNKEESILNRDEPEM